MLLVVGLKNAAEAKVATDAKAKIEETVPCIREGTHEGVAASYTLPVVFILTDASNPFKPHLVCPIYIHSLYACK